MPEPIYDGYVEPPSRTKARQMRIETKLEQIRGEIELEKKANTPPDEVERVVDGIKITPVLSLKSMPSRSYMHDADSDEEAVKVFKSMKIPPTQLFKLRKTYFAAVPDDDDTVPVFPD